MATQSLSTHSQAGGFLSWKATTKLTDRHDEKARKTRKEVRMLRVQSPLSADVEQLVHDTIGCCIRVHRELGPGLFERIYSRALCIELKASGIQFEREKRYMVTYRGEAVCDQYLDLVVANQ